MSSSKNNKPKNMTPDQQRITKLEERLSTVEEQLLSCLQFMRFHAEKEAKKKDPDYIVHTKAEA